MCDEGVLQATQKGQVSRRCVYLPFSLFVEEGRPHRFYIAQFGQQFMPFHVGRGCAHDRGLVHMLEGDLAACDREDAIDGLLFCGNDIFLKMTDTWNGLLIQ